MDSKVASGIVQDGLWFGEKAPFGPARVQLKLRARRQLVWAQHARCVLTRHSGRVVHVQHARCWHTTAL